MQLMLRKDATHTPMERSVGALHILSEYIREPYFKRLLNAIAGAQYHSNFKTLAVLSQQPGEGKTFFVCSVALAYSQYLQGRVLIVDTTKQTRDKLLFLECLISEAQNGVVNGHANGNGNGNKNGKKNSRIDFLTTRNINGGAHDWSDFQLASYIDRFKQEYDLVLIDTCALEVVDRYATDPLIVARGSDASVLITSKQTLKKERLSEIQRELKSSEVNLLGTVFNGGAA